VLHTPKWWNWHTQGTQNPPGLCAHAGSTPAFGTIFFLLLASGLPSQTVTDRITAVVNGRVVMLSEVRLMQSLQSGPLPFEEARDRVIREKLRLQDIVKFAVYTFPDDQVLRVLAESDLPDSPEHRGAVRRALIVGRYIDERFAPLVAVSDAQVSDFLGREYPVHSIRPGSPDWEMARRAAGVETLEALVEDWDRRLRESAEVKMLEAGEDAPLSPPDR
jgi:hypothetical protein